MQLGKLVSEAGLVEGLMSLHDEVLGLAIDSRKVAKGFVFIAIKGHTVDGHLYLEKAIEAGALAVVVDKNYELETKDVHVFHSADTAQSAGMLAHIFYGRPSSQIRLVGITGTNGKTTTATLLYQLMMSMGYKTGLLSTVENRIGTEVIPATHTTPDPIALNALLADMVQSGCEFAFMEVSSHAVHQKRIAGLEFEGGVFTNISRDHLDYHETFEEYIWVKKAFFDHLPKSAFALSNVDDKRGLVMLQNTVARTSTYSLKKSADFKGKILENTLEGLFMSLNGTEVHLRLIGEFNAYNILCAFAIGSLLGMPTYELLTHLSGLKGAPGRFETLRDLTRQVLYIVDYAHTPDALEKVLETIQVMKPKNSKIFTVVGCGGNRDKGKRPMMASIAVKYSDEVIFTSDNPRDEDPEEILKEMLEGVNEPMKSQVLTITDRLQAIKTAAKLAQQKDIVLVAGKGHENYQEIKGVRHRFDDREVIKDIIEI